MGTSKENAERQKSSRYEIVITRSAIKQLTGIAEPYQTNITKKIDSLSLEPRPFGVEKLSSRKNEYRVRVGTYRIVYSIFDKQLLVEVIDIDHRKQIYR